ncbi:hypothetical protein T05_1654 [Trichinella murrelli]|uniref:Uncharacterized protein n=1 Tax=Trichinella murrelli TaxID=144512 RepID=A0A0V0TNC6_9BILA|nr:hypothetical protein T05_1654 [Trichinella murrelli]
MTCRSKKRRDKLTNQRKYRENCRRVRKCKHFYFNVETSNSTRKAAKRKYNKVYTIRIARITALRLFESTAKTALNRLHFILHNFIITNGSQLT